MVTGIGFLGAGAILHRARSVEGLTTAASVWVVAAIGMAAGAGFYLLSAVTAVIVFVVLVLDRLYRKEPGLLKVVLKP